MAHWPTARDFSEALQNPQIAFKSPVLKGLVPALDKFGMPVIASGNFAAVCKMGNDVDAFAVRFFTRDPGDRQTRYELIHRYLDVHNIACIADFEYRPEEVLIAGRRYPVIQMEWIQGVRLDVFVEDVLGKGDVLGLLADQWLRIVSALKEAGVAHGDLQHGNVIVEPGPKLRLVDLDGMFVPGMTHLGACEEGHRAYQHPKRIDAPFDARLDRFSALVIYLSLIALKSKPMLWQRFHDDNLIFKRADFLDPSSSALFGMLRRESGHIGRMCEALLDACRGRPEGAPMLADLGEKPSRLPDWMRATSGVSVTTRTREVATGTPPVQPPTTQPRPGDGRASGTPTRPVPPWGPPQPQPGSAPKPATTPPKPPFPVDACIKHALFFAVFPCLFPIGFLGIPISHSVLVGMGAESRSDYGVTWLVYLSVSFGVGLWFAVREELDRRSRPAYLPSSTTTVSTPASSPRNVPATPPQPTVAGTAVVGSRIRTKFHRPGCRWARKISSRNRITFASSADARRAGYRPCGECRPS